MKVVFATSLFSPFQLDVARAVNRIPGVEYHLAFTLPFRAARGRHWQEDVSPDLAGRVAVAPYGLSDERAARWLAGVLDRVKADCVISGAIHGPIHAASEAHARGRGVAIGFWLEPPDPRRWFLRRLLVKEVIRRRLAGARFVLAIGDRAEAVYGAVCSNVALVPYGEDLSPCFAMQRTASPGRPVRFLYSGQLLPRQNVGLILDAASAILRERGRTFTVCIAGHGPDQRAIDERIRRHPALRDVVEYDREYDSWVSRLRPFARSDVLVYPSAHSGWGLVVPEAMAAGLKVITTRHVEAARFFVRHRVTGVFVEPRAADLEREMVECLDRYEDVIECGERARQCAKDGDAPAVAARLVKALTRFA